MQFASDYDSSSRNIVSGVLRVDATQWDRGKFECQVSEKYNEQISFALTT